MSTPINGLPFILCARVVSNLPRGKALKVSKALFYKIILLHYPIEKIFMLWVCVVLVNKAAYGWTFMNMSLLKFLVRMGCGIPLSLFYGLD